MPVAKRKRVDAPVIASLAGAAVAGLSGSVHCGLMCGPLACAGLPSDPAARLRAAGAWHLGRAGAYAIVGALLGGVGGAVALTLSTSVQPVLPWVLAAGLVAAAFDVGRWLKPIPGVGAIARALTRSGARLSPALRSGLVGAATPFLPCGLLYGVFLAALATGSPLRGAALMACFAAGGALALAATQLPQVASLRPHPWLRRGVLLSAAAVLIWRAASAQPDAPSCH